MTFRAAGVVYDNGSYVADATMIVAAPAGVVDGDLLIMIGGSDFAGSVFTLPAGWTRVPALEPARTPSDSLSSVLATKTASSEPATYDVSNDQSTEVSVGIIAYSNVSGFDVTPTAAHINEGTGVGKYDTVNPTSKPITTVTDGAEVVLVQWVSYSEITAGGAPSGYTLRLDHTPFEDRNILVADRVVSTAGLETPGAWQNTAGTSFGDSSTVTFALAQTVVATPLTIDSVDTDNAIDLGQQGIDIELANSPDTITSVTIDGITQVIDSQTPGASDARTVTINATGYIPDGINAVIVDDGTETSNSFNIDVNNPYIYTAPTVVTDSNSIFNGQFYSAGSKHYVVFTGANADKITYTFASVESGSLWDNNVNDWITPDAGFGGVIDLTLYVWDATTSTIDSITGTITVNPAVSGPDTEKPVITLIGSTPVTHTQNTTYTDPGANVTDNVDAGSVLVAQGSVNTAVVGSYILTYNYQDAAGNDADTVTRTVDVVSVIPVIVLNGLGTVYHIVDTTYTDAGAIATDNVDIDAAVVAVGSVDTATKGTYTLTYDHTDSDSNVAVTVYRSVVVFDPSDITSTDFAVLSPVLLPVLS